MNRTFLFTFASVLFLCCAQPVMSIEITEFEVCINPADQINPDMYYNYIVWQDYRITTGDINIYAQRIDKDGNPLWDPDGMAVCTNTANQENPVVVGEKIQKI